MSNTGHAICLGCGERMWASHHYLCHGCWFTLPAETRRRLNLRDADARNRLFQLFSSLNRRVSLALIEVSA